MDILGIETSCDETAAAVVRGEDVGTKDQPLVRVLSDVIYSQIDVHKQWGGVVPEVAAREHVLKIIPVIDEALALARAKGKIAAIAVANGPGLITSLAVGVETAKALSYAWNVPLVAVNHIEAHVYANFIDPGTEKIPSIEFPALVLTVSGGHTILLLMRRHGEMKAIGETRDDAAGEAFDKGAKMLGLGYPGGPAIAAVAAQFQNARSEAPNKPQISNSKFKIIMPRPMLNSADLDFSFSGLKTALRYALRSDPDWKDRIREYCREYQQAIIDVLLHKTAKAAKKYKVRTVMLAGGVAANAELRKQFREKIDAEVPAAACRIPGPRYTTDNAAMVAAAGYFKALDKKYINWQDLNTDCNLKP